MAKHIERHTFTDEPAADGSQVDPLLTLNSFLRAHAHRHMRVVSIETLLLRPLTYVVWLEVDQ